MAWRYWWPARVRFGPAPRVGSRASGPSRWRPAVLFRRSAWPFSHGPAAAGPDAPVVRLIQPNAPQHLKWQPDLIPGLLAPQGDLTAAPRTRSLARRPRGLAGNELSDLPARSAPTPRACSFRVAAGGAPVADRRADRVEGSGAQFAGAGGQRGSWPRSMTSITSCRSANTCRCRGSHRPGRHRGARGEEGAGYSRVRGRGCWTSDRWAGLSDDLLRGDLSRIHRRRRPSGPTGWCMSPTTRGSAILGPVPAPRANPACAPPNRGCRCCARPIPACRP
jgi:hypothetical protein